MSTLVVLERNTGMTCTDAECRAENRNIELDFDSRVFPAVYGFNNSRKKGIRRRLFIRSDCFTP